MPSQEAVILPAHGLYSGFKYLPNCRDGIQVEFTSLQERVLHETFQKLSSIMTKSFITVPLQMQIFEEWFQVLFVMKEKLASNILNCFTAT